MSYSSKRSGPAERIDVTQLASEIAELLQNKININVVGGVASSSTAVSNEPNFQSDSALADAMVKRSASVGGKTNLGTKTAKNTVEVSAPQNLTSILDMLKGIPDEK
jgi:hypothetical protein